MPANIAADRAILRAPTLVLETILMSFLPFAIWVAATTRAHGDPENLGHGETLFFLPG
jgi:hypothetical protein